MDTPGAVAAPDDIPDQGVAWHYGDPFAEQRIAAWPWSTARTGNCSPSRARTG
jgi:hypothetical protein